MSIIFNEYEYSKVIIENGVDKIVQRDLNYVAKFYDYEGFSKSKIQAEVECFCLRNDVNFNLVQSRLMIKRALTNCKDNHLRFPEPIGITAKELETIRKVIDYRKQKLLFCILVTAKFFKHHSSKKKPDEHRKEVDLYINQPIKDIIELSGTNLSMKDWKKIKHEFCVDALLSPTRVSSSRFSIGFEDKISEPEIIINDYRNIVGYYQNYCGEAMIECEVCKVSTLKRSYTHCMCASCWKEKYKKINRERMRLERLK